MNDDLIASTSLRWENARFYNHTSRVPLLAKGGVRGGSSLGLRDVERDRVSERDELGLKTSYALL